jgi:hypothetical protein
MPPIWTDRQPLGLAELELNAARRYRRGTHNSLIRDDRIRCCVRDCQKWLAKRRRGGIDPKAFCPIHHISVSTSPTYVYEDYRQNFIIDVPLLEHVKKLKVESGRLGNERSEDAVSWNVFVGLTGLNGLKDAYKIMTGMEVDTEPEIYLWGVRISDKEPRVWDRLRQVRFDLEKGVRWATEPDVILRVPRRAIVLIEAKFGSPNGTMLRQKKRFGTVAKFLNTYRCRAGEVDPLNRAWIKKQPPGQILQQLVRNVIFANWLAGDGEVQLVVNLVRAAEEQDVGDRFKEHLAANGRVRFRRCAWEELFRLPLLASEEARPLRCYLKNKTNRLARAFEPWGISV